MCRAWLVGDHVGLFVLLFCIAVEREWYQCLADGMQIESRDGQIVVTVRGTRKKLFVYSFSCIHVSCDLLPM